MAQIDTYIPGTFGPAGLESRLGKTNAGRFIRFPGKATPRLVRDAHGEQVFVYSFVSRLGLEVWVIPAESVEGNPATQGEVAAWRAIKANLAQRGEPLSGGFEPATNRTSDGEVYTVAETALERIDYYEG